MFTTMSGFNEELFRSLAERPASERTRQAVPHEELEGGTVVALFPPAPVLRSTAGSWATVSPSGHDQAGRTIVHVMNFLSSLDVSRADKRARTVLAGRLGLAHQQPRRAESSFTPAEQPGMTSDSPQDRPTTRFRVPWRR